MERASIFPPPTVPNSRPSAVTSIFDPRSCGVEPMVSTTVTATNGRPDSARSLRASKKVTASLSASVYPVCCAPSSAFGTFSPARRGRRRITPRALFSPKADAGVPCARDKLEAMRIRSNRVLLPDGTRPATIVIEGERIAAIENGPADQDFGELVIMPGLVDSHVHVNEPGRTEWEGFETATRAASAGGITTIVDMPLNSIPATTTLAALEIKQRALEGKCQVDVALWGGVVPGNTKELRPMLDAGAAGFKCFLVHSGVEDFPNVNEEELREAAKELASTGAPLLVHAELPEYIEDRKSVV